MLNEEQIKEKLDKGTLWDYVLDEIGKKHIGDIKAREVVLLCAVGRLLKGRKPYSFNVLLLTKSSSGKDHLIRAVLKLFDEYNNETKSGVWERYGRISETTLNYLHQRKEDKENPEKSRDLNFSWSEKILYLPEITNKVLNNEVMKEFTAGENSEDISKVAITKRKSAGVDIIEVRGKPEVFCSTAKTIPTEEIMNRFNIVGVDLSEEQTRATFGHEEGDIDPEIIKYLSKLKPREVQIPKKILNFMIKNFPADKIRARRDFPRLEDFVGAYSLFHNRAIATAEDYNRAKDIFINAYSTPSDIPLKDIDEDIIKVLRESKEESLEAREIWRDLDNGEKYTLKTIYTHLEGLEEAEIIKSKQARVLTGYFVTKYFLTKEFKANKPLILPNYED